MMLRIDINRLGAILWSFRSYHILLLLWLPNEVGETYCFCSVSYYYVSQTKCVRHIVLALCLLLLLLIIIIPLSASLFPSLFSEMPWSNFMKPCRNIICHVKLCLYGLMFSKWLSLPWKRPKCKKIEKHKYDHSRLLAEQKLMKLDRNNIHIKWNKISKKNRNWLNKLCCSCHGKRGF